MSFAGFTIDLSVPMVYIIRVFRAQNPEAYAMGKNIKGGLRNIPGTLSGHGSRLDCSQRLIPPAGESAQ